MTLRLRLTFWYSAVLAVIIALFGCVVYLGTNLVLIRQMDMSMVGTAQTILNTSHLWNSFEATQLQIPRLDRLGVQRTIVQAWDTKGNLVSASDNNPSADPLDVEGLRKQKQTVSNLVVAGLHLRS